MAKFAKKVKEAESEGYVVIEGVALSEGDAGEDGILMSPEHQLPPKSQSPDAREIEVKGAKHQIGSIFTFGEREVTLVDERVLKTSANAGITEGVYPIVSILLKPSNRAAYRAIVGDALYPIRGYGTSGEVIAKIRGEAKQPRARKARTAAAGESHVLSLTTAAARTFDTYLDMKPTENGEQVLSALVLLHLGPEVEKMLLTREAIQKLPHDLLAALAGANEETRRRVLEMLR